MYLGKYICIMDLWSLQGFCLLYIFLVSFSALGYVEKHPSLKRLKHYFFCIFKEQESLWTRRHLLMFPLCIFRLVLLFAIVIFVLAFLSLQYVYLPFKICEKYFKRKEKMLVFQNPIIMHFQICQTHLC